MPSLRAQTAAEIARLFKIHPATVSRLLAQARVEVRAVPSTPLAYDLGEILR